MEKIPQHYFAFNPQSVRWMDMVFVAPIMIYAGVKGEFKPYVKFALIAIGSLTFLYNGINYVTNLQNGEK